MLHNAPTATFSSSQPYKGPTAFPRGPEDRLLSLWDRATPDQRASFIERAGIAEVFDVIVGIVR